MNTSVIRFCSIFLLMSIVLLHPSFSQKRAAKNPVYIDREGVMRWQHNKAEAAFFGVNYSTPFAHAYRAHQALGVNLEHAIQQDVYHMARLGFDAFRVHVWDNEISDVEGNLLENDHLRLYDFLIAELKKRNIKTIVTPIAFWGNGYPERDQEVPGFSSFYGRGKLTTNDSAIVAQENFLRQFFRHVNPYTKLSYQDDPDIIAVEINNEPAHSGPKPGVTSYINRLAAAIKSTGWTKPVFYNISQGPYYADAVAASVADGFSFQWYPSGLVANRTLQGNYLPHVDKYTIPFDTIAAFRKKPLMVYEFDAADILDSYMYPAMARSFREAGFQWATQFAYDPLAIAHANTEYQTHYLNLAYTPAKAISALIASKVFHKVPRRKNFGVYPADSVFDAFRVSYRQALSEMNTENEFYYSNATSTRPVNLSKLQHVAGVGSSSVVEYEGSGAYFLDKLEDGVWRLEVMPDAIFIRDPFERASPHKEVTRIQWNSNSMAILLPDLGSDFEVKGLNQGNTFSGSAQMNRLKLSPGSYLLTASGARFSGNAQRLRSVQLHEFVAPASRDNSIVVRHEPYAEVTAGRSFNIKALVVGIDSGSVLLQIAKMGGASRMIPMQRISSAEYSAEVPSEFATPGLLNYRMIVRSGTEVAVFPGNHQRDPFAWDSYEYETWDTYVADEHGNVELFNPTTDRDVRTYPTFRRGFQTAFVTGERSGQLILRMTANSLADVQSMGFQYTFVRKLQGRKDDLAQFDRVVIRARSTGESPVRAKVLLTNADGSSLSALVTLTSQFEDIEVPLKSLSPDAALLLPRPYPGFLPVTFAGAPVTSLDLSSAERVEITIGSGLAEDQLSKPQGMEVEGVWLRKE